MREWRLCAGKWVNLIETAHDAGNDRTVHTTFKVLVQKIYTRGLPGEQQKIVDEAQKNKKINYLNLENAVQVAPNIAKIVVADPQTSKVRRLIASFNKVSNYLWKNDEDIYVFVSCLRVTAAEHLEHSNPFSSSQIGQLIAINILNNANLDESTLTQCKLSLISLADTSAKTSSSTNTFTVNE